LNTRARVPLQWAATQMNLGTAPRLDSTVAMTRHRSSPSSAAAPILPPIVISHPAPSRAFPPNDDLNLAGLDVLQKPMSEVT